MAFFGRKPPQPRVFTNAPREWPQVEIEAWTGNVGLDTLMVFGEIAEGLAARGGRVLGMLERRLYDDGVLTIPVLLEVGGQRFGLFVYPRADAEAAAHYSGVRSLLRQREQATAVYYASAAIQPAAPAEVLETLMPEHFSKAGEDRGEAEYALFWPTEDDPRLATSPARGFLDRWFAALQGHFFVFLTGLARTLELSGEDDAPGAWVLPAQPTMIGVTAPGGTTLVLHASQGDGLWFAFDVRTPAAERNRLLGQLALSAEELRAAIQEERVPPRPEEGGVQASWNRRRDDYLAKEAAGAAGLRLGAVAERGSARLSAAGATSLADRDAGAPIGEQPSEGLVDFARSQLAHAFERVRHAAAEADGGPNLQAFVAGKDPGGHWRSVLHLTEAPEALAFAPEILAEHPQVELATVVCDGYLRVGGERSDAIMVQAQERGGAQSYVFAQRYRVADGGDVELLGNWLLTGLEASFWPAAETTGGGAPSERLLAFLEERVKDRLRWLALGEPDDEPLADDDSLLSPHLEHLKDGQLYTDGYMMMGLPAALPLARRKLAEEPSCQLASLEYDDPSTRDGRPARSIRFWVQERGTPRAFLYALPYEPPRKGASFSASAPISLVRTTEPLFPG